MAEPVSFLETGHNLTQPTIRFIRHLGRLLTRVKQHPIARKHNRMSLLRQTRDRIISTNTITQADTHFIAQTHEILRTPKNPQKEKTQHNITRAREITTTVVKALNLSDTLMQQWDNPKGPIYQGQGAPRIFILPGGHRWLQKVTPDPIYIKTSELPLFQKVVETVSKVDNLLPLEVMVQMNDIEFLDIKVMFMRRLPRDVVERILQIANIIQKPNEIIFPRPSFVQHGSFFPKCPKEHCKVICNAPDFRLNVTINPVPQTTQYTRRFKFHSYKYDTDSEHPYFQEAHLMPGYEQKRNPEPRPPQALLEYSDDDEFIVLYTSTEEIEDIRSFTNWENQMWQHLEKYGTIHGFGESYQNELLRLTRGGRPDDY